jgi:hypothetical protein
MGPPETLEWFDAIFHRAAQRERAAGATGRGAAERRLLFYAAIHAALITATDRMVRLRVTATATTAATPSASTPASAATPPQAADATDPAFPTSSATT